MYTWMEVIISSSVSVFSVYFIEGTRIMTLMHISNKLKGGGWGETYKLLDTFISPTQPLCSTEPRLHEASDLPLYCSSRQEIWSHVLSYKSGPVKPVVRGTRLESWSENVCPVFFVVSLFPWSKFWSRLLGYRSVRTGRGNWAGFIWVENKNCPFCWSFFLIKHHIILI